ncbi:sodium-coupled monocarboxylate transporter 1 [Malaya genurostris]|uniref:sodium-coupled monocarboxylate transporter 1 n=1 Tax=Malaya genurostris TaxID=325434 RepID=UPI0026F3E338|nr:sodium-coupled monocarboxylate transporter 1 [Malaya genurostris]
METFKIVVLIGCALAVAARPESDSSEWPECGSEENLHQGEFSPYDYSAVGFMLVVSLGIGVFYGYFVKPKKVDGDPSSNDFLLGSGMTVFPVTLSLTTSFITAIELLGNPSEMFYSGTQFALIVIAALLVIPVAVKLFYPMYYKMNLTSCYEYLGTRFNSKIRIFGAILYILQMSFYTSVAVLAPAIALSKATGLDTHVAVVLIYFVCVFYSSQGGMKAVVIADTFQACILALSLVLVVAFGWYYTGGPVEVFTRAQENGRIELLNLSTNPTTRHSVYSVVIGGFFYWTSLFCTNQAAVQKCMSLKSLDKAKKAIYLSIIGLVLVFLFNFYTGLMTFAHYTGCDPLRSGQITEKDQLVPFFVMDVLGHVKSMTGIFVAGIFAASLGTVAAALNSLSAVTCEDLLVSGLGMKIPPEKGAMYAKWMSLGYGVFSFGLVFVVERLGGILQATLTLNGLIGGVTLGLFALGLFFRNANSKGALYGGILALAFVVYIGVMAQIYGEPVTPLPSSIDACNCTQTTSSSLVVVGVETFGGIGSRPRQTGESCVGFTGHWIGRNHAGSSESSPWASVYQISYMWYSFLGTILTIFFGFIISLMTGGLCVGKQMSIDLLTTLGDSAVSKQEEKCTKVLRYSRSGDDGNPDAGKGRKSITRDDSIRIQIGAPLTMMMKTGVSSEQENNKKQRHQTNGSVYDEGGIFAIGGYRNQADGNATDSGWLRSTTQLMADGPTVKIERERF